MHYKQLCTTGLQVSKICLGTMTWGYQNTERDAHKQLDYAVSQGVNFIDTAELYPVPPMEAKYTLTEQYIGNWLATQDRQKIILATKIAGPGTHIKWIREGSGFSKENIIDAVEGSLKRLQTDYIDLYQLHRPQRKVQLRGKLNYHESMLQHERDEEAHIIEILQVCDELIKAGKIRHIGLSNETPWGTMKFLELSNKYHLPRVQSIQNAYNLLRRDFDIGLAEVAMQEKVGLLAYSPLAGGILTGKYQNGALPASSRYATRGKERMPYYAKEKSFQAVDRYIALAEEIGTTVTKLALAWVNDRGFVTSNIIGATSMEQLQQDISSANLTLSEDVYKKIDEIFLEGQNVACW